MDERGSFAAKVGNLSLLAALILEGLHDMRGAAVPGPVPRDYAERCNFMSEFLVEAWNGALPLNEVVAVGDEPAAVIPAPPPSLARQHGAIGDEYQAYDLVHRLQEDVESPADVARFAQKATHVLTLLRDLGIAGINGEDELFLTTELEPFLERLAWYSQEIIHRQTRSADLFTR